MREKRVSDEMRFIPSHYANRAGRKACPVFVHMIYALTVLCPTASSP